MEQVSTDDIINYICVIRMEGQLTHCANVSNTSSLT